MVISGKSQGNLGLFSGYSHDMFRVNSGQYQGGNLWVISGNLGYSHDIFRQYQGNIRVIFWLSQRNLEGNVWVIKG